MSGHIYSEEKILHLKVVIHMLLFKIFCYATLFIYTENVILIFPTMVIR